MSWISINDRLPEDGAFVMAFNGKIHLVKINDRAGPGIGMLWGSEPDSWGLRNVTHWMPLPELPK